MIFSQIAEVCDGLFKTRLTVSQSIEQTEQDNTEESEVAGGTEKGKSMCAIWCINENDNEGEGEIG